MTRAFLPGLFDDERVFFRPLRDDVKNWAAALASAASSSEIGLYEDEEFVVVEIPLPGLKSDEIKVDLKEGVLYVQGDKKEERKEVKIHRKLTSKYAYSVLLPQPVDEKGVIDAEIKEGILVVRLAKTRASKPIKIAVRGS